jgi:hypothetical protein
MPSMAWEILQEALTMSNECVQEVNNDNLLDALYLLQHVVAKVRNVLALSTSASEIAPEARTLDLPTQMPSMCAFTGVCQFSFKFRRWSLSHPKCQRSIHENSDIYDYPLLLFLTVNSGAIETEGSNSQDMVIGNDCRTNFDFTVLSVFSAAMLFNLALICHRIGMMYGRDTLLIRASKLYSVIIELLNKNAHVSSSASSTDCGTSTEVLLLTLALNNSGQIQYELCNYPAYHQCMAALRNLILNRHSGGSVENDATSMIPMDGIRTNLMLWKFLSSSVAHAA